MCCCAIGARVCLCVCFHDTCVFIPGVLLDLALCSNCFHLFCFRTLTSAPSIGERCCPLLTAGYRPFAKCSHRAFRNAQRGLPWTCLSCLRHVTGGKDCCLQATVSCMLKTSSGLMTMLPCLAAVSSRRCVVETLFGVALICFVW